MEQNSAIGVIFIEINAAYDPAIAVSDLIITHINTLATINPLLNDINPDKNVLIIESITQPLHGTAYYSSASLSYLPSTDYYGDDLFTYTLFDGKTRTTADVQVAVIYDYDLIFDIDIDSIGNDFFCCFLLKILLLFLSLEKLKSLMNFQRLWTTV